MKMVEVLIRIPIYDYEYILSQGDTRGTPHLAEAISKGIVLQKGHKKLIDEEKTFKELNSFLYNQILYSTWDTVIKRTTVIEADEEE